jgi:hypothetical protein
MRAWETTFKVLCNISTEQNNFDDATGALDDLIVSIFSNSLQGLHWYAFCAPIVLILPLRPYRDILYYLYPVHFISVP